MIAEDWAQDRWHIDIWTGNDTDGGRAQVDRENNLLPVAKLLVIRQPASDLEVDRMFPHPSHLFLVYGIE